MGVFIFLLIAVLQGAVLRLDFKDLIKIKYLIAPTIGTLLIINLIGNCGC